MEYTSGANSCNGAKDFIVTSEASCDKKDHGVSSADEAELKDCVKNSGGTIKVKGKSIACQKRFLGEKTCLPIEWFD